MIAAQSIQEIRDRADILEVVGYFVQLRRRGTNYIGLCPFHNEKTPSFNVNPTRGIFKCFGCGKAGDALTFVIEHEKFTFVEAVRWLAEFYHIELEETESTDQQKENKQLSESLRILYEYATNLFEDQLWNNEEGQIIGLSYFKERGLNDKIIKDFRLGYALESWDAFYSKAKMDGYSNETLLQSGLVAEKNDKIYDNYRGRVIFPIPGNTGKVLGFGARILKNNVKAPKYVNTPENAIYNKSNVLYGLYQSRNAIHQSNECFLVEGYMDVISLHQNEIENVVASSGTSLTEGQLRLIKNLTKNLTIIYDGDEAGIKAAIRGMEMALMDSFNVQIVLLPDGSDPDSFVQKNGSEELLNFIQKNKKNIIDFLIDLKLEAVKHDANAKNILVNEIAQTISLVNKAEDFVIQQDFIKNAAKRLDIDEQGMINLVNKKIREQFSKQKKPDQIIDANLIEENENLPEITDAQTLPKNNKEEWKVIEILLKYGDKPFEYDESILTYFFEHYDNSTFENLTALRIVQQIEEMHESGKKQQDIIRYFVQNNELEIQSLSIDLLLEKATPNPKWQTQLGIKHGFEEDLYREEARSAFAYFELSVLDRMIDKNLQDIQSKEIDDEELMTLMKVHSQLKERAKSLLNIVVKKY